MTSLIQFLTDKRHDSDPFLHFYSGGKHQQMASYKTVYQSAYTKASVLVQHIDRFQPVLIEGTNTMEFLTNFLATQMAGGIPVPITTNLWITEKYYKNIVNSIIEATHAKVFLGSFKLNLNTNLRVIGTQDWQRYQPSPHFRPVDIEEHDPALLQFSSGSTGLPKGIVLSHKNILANIRQITAAIQCEEGNNRTVSWLPVHHDMGLIGGLLVPFVNQYECALMNPYDFAVNPDRWLKLMTQFKANIIVAPNSGYHLAQKRTKQQALDSYDLSSVRIALCGAEPINIETMNKFATFFSQCGFKSSAIRPCYGMAENTLAISIAKHDHLNVEYLDLEQLYKEKLAIPQYGEMIKEAIPCISCGKPLDGIKVKIINSKGVELTERQVGEILIQGPSTSKGYYQRPDLNKELFHEGYLRTGDLGYIANGEIFITGRKKDVIIQNGLNINAEEVEMSLIQNEHIRPGRLVAVAQYCESKQSEEIALIVETKPLIKYLSDKTRSDMRTEIHQEINNFLSVKIENIHIVAPGTIQKTTSGKVKRAKMKQMLQEKSVDNENFVNDFIKYKLMESSVKTNIVMREAKGSVIRSLTGLFN